MYKQMISQRLEQTLPFILDDLVRSIMRMLLLLYKQIDRRQLDVRLRRRLEEGTVRLEELVEFVGWGFECGDWGCGCNRESLSGRGEEVGFKRGTYPTRGAGPVS